MTGCREYNTYHSLLTDLTQAQYVDVYTHSSRPIYIKNIKLYSTIQSETYNVCKNTISNIAVIRGGNGCMQSYTVYGHLQLMPILLLKLL